MTGQSGNRSDDRAINRSHDRANDRSLKKSILYSNERARRGEDEQVEENHDRSIWNRSDDRAINRSHDRANDRSLKNTILYSNERARKGEDEQVEESHDRSIWNRSHDRANDRSLKNTILYSIERARRGEDEQVEESHDRSIWNRSDDRAINRSHDRANDRSLKKSILYSNERARRGEDEQVEGSHERSIWNRSDDRAINRSHDRANDRSLKKSILYSNERARRGEDDKPKTSTQMTDLSSENVNERFHPWKIRMYRVHSGSSVYEERSVASMDDAASGFDTPRSAFATTNAAVSRTETAEARRPSRYRPNQEARRGTREHCSEIGIHPTRSESYNLMSGRRRGRSSEDPTGRDFSFDRPQQLVPEVGYRDNNRAYGYSEYDTNYSVPNVGNDVSRHFDERELYRGYGGWDADGRTDDCGIEQSFPTSERRYDNDHGYSSQDAGINFCDREYSRYRSPSRERSRTFCAGPSFEPNPGSKTFSGRFQDRTRPMSRSPEYAAHTTTQCDEAGEV